jgi:hypothetical protein
VAARLSRGGYACALRSDLIAWGPAEALSLIPLPTCQNEGCSRESTALTKRSAWLKHGYQKGIWLGEMKADQAVRGIWACFCDQRLTRAPKPPGIPRDQGSGIWRATGAYARGSTFQATERAQLRVPAAARARGLHRSPLERMKRAQGRPGDRCTPGPSRQKIAQRARDHTYRRRHFGLPCAMVLRLIGALGEPSRLPPSPFAKLSASLGLGAKALGRQDHTTSPYAISAARRSAHARPSHPAARVVTFAGRPSCRAGRKRPSA